MLTFFSPLLFVNVFVNLTDPDFKGSNIKANAISPGSPGYLNVLLPVYLKRGIILWKVQVVEVSLV